MELTAEDMKLSPEELSKKINSEFTGLHDKNTELIGDKKKLGSILEAFGDNTPEKIADMLSTIEKLNDEKLTDAERLERDSKAQAERFTAIETENLKLKNDNAKIVRDNAIGGLIPDLGVPVNGLAGALRREIAERITDKDGGGYLFDGKPLAEGGAEWANGDGQVFFVPKNSGGGGQGSGGGAVSTKGFENEDGSLNHTKIAQARRGTPDQVAEVNAVVEAHGKK